MSTTIFSHFQSPVDSSQERQNSGAEADLQRFYDMEKVFCGVAANKKPRPVIRGVVDIPSKVEG